MPGTTFDSERFALRADYLRANRDGESMKILVTGALGFIGAHFVERALTAGHQVTGLYRGAEGDKQELLESLEQQGALLAQGDVLQPERYQSVMVGVDCVCHFAAAFKGANHTDEDFHHINVLGTEAVLRAAAKAGVRRFVLCSTAGIYGQRCAGVTDESAQARPWNSYERSKHAAEECVRRLAPQLQMEFVILRPAVVYGPRDDRLLKLFTTAAKGQFPLFGPGQGRRHMVYVTDVAEAFLLACTQPQAGNEEMIIAGPEATPLKAMLDTLAGVVGRSRCGPRLPLAPMLLLAALVEDFCKLIRINPPIYRRRMDFYRSDAAFDCSRARRLMGWQPRVSLRDGLRRTYEATERSSSLRHVAAIAGALTIGVGYLCCVMGPLV
ncbi:MAG: NAD(P)-dependent oxidoreductase [Steroidobacteraceae bacterium]